MWKRLFNILERRYGWLRDGTEIASAEALVLPGVGAFRDAMHSLEAGGMAQPIRDYIASGRPFLGICLGLQLLLRESEEFGHVKGLGAFKGRICRIPAENGLKVPHMRLELPLN